MKHDPPDSSQAIIHWRCRKASFTWESIKESCSKCNASHLPNHFFMACIHPELTILLLCIFWNFWLASHAIVASQCKGF